MNRVALLFGVFLLCLSSSPATSQIAPSAAEVAVYSELLAAAHNGDTAVVQQLIDTAAALNTTDSADRTALHIAAFASHEEVVIALANAGADMNALEFQAYDVATIAAVENDLEMLDTVLNHGASAANITSPYYGTALIAASHLGHHQVVKRLIEAGAPLDHVNNLGWTALIEAVILGDGGADHIKTVSHLVQAGADQSLTDKQGRTPLQLARSHGYNAIEAILTKGEN